MSVDSKRRVGEAVVMVTFSDAMASIKATSDTDSVNEMAD
jgi:hypothetical protein